MQVHVEGGGYDGGAWRMRSGKGGRKLRDGSNLDCFEYKTEEEEDDSKNSKDGILEGQTSLKWDFRDERWKDPNFMYNPVPKDFSRLPRGPSFIYNAIPSLIMLFELFGPPILCTKWWKRPIGMLEHLIMALETLMEGKIGRILL